MMKRVFIWSLALALACTPALAHAQSPQVRATVLQYKLPAPSGGGSDPATTAWVSAVVTAGGTVSSPRQTIVNTFIVCLKSNSLFSTFDRYWLFAGENAASATVDMINTASNTPTNAPTFTANVGYGPSSGTSYVDTVLASPTQCSQNSCTYGGQDQTNTASASFNFSIYGAANAGFSNVSSFKPATAGANTEVRVNQAGADAFAVTTTKGSWVLTRTGASAGAVYFNGSSGAAPGGTFTTASTPLPGVSFFVLGINQGGAMVANDTNDVISSFFLASGWNSTQASAFEGCQNAMMTSIGINVH